MTHRTEDLLLNLSTSTANCRSHHIRVSPLPGMTLPRTFDTQDMLISGIGVDMFNVSQPLLAGNLAVMFF